MQVGQLVFKQDMLMARPRNITCATGSRAVLYQGLASCADNIGMNAHREIIIRAPDGDAPSGAMIIRPNTALRLTLQIGKDAIAPFPA